MKVVNLLLLSAAAATMTGCSLFKNNTNTIKGSSATAVEGDRDFTTLPAVIDENTKPVVVDVPTTLPATAEGRPVVVETPVTDPEPEKNAVMPEGPIDEAYTLKEPAKTVAPQKELSQLASDIAGEWYIIQAGTYVIDLDEGMPYIIFEPSTGRIYANDGCNTINGEYNVTDEGCLTFSNLLSTLMLCPDVEFSKAIDSAIGFKPVYITMRDEDTQSFIDVKNEKGEILLKLRRGNLGFINGHWEVKAVSGIDKLETPADVFFDLGELKIHGNTGCNYFNGTIYLDYRRKNAVDFSNMGVTRIACPNRTQETAILVALQQAATAVHGAHDQLILLDDSGVTIMVLHRIPLAEEK